MSRDEQLQRRQLERCGVPVLPGSPLVGSLRGFTFRFYNYYWVVDGAMPLDVALRLYAHPVGKADIRAGGHCGCPSPAVYGAEYFDAEGNRLYSDPDGKEAQQVADFISKGLADTEALSGVRFVADKRVGFARAEVHCYHVDSELGLYLLVEAIRALPASAVSR